MLRVDARQRRHILVDRHHLAGDLDGAEAVTRAVLCLHATDPASVYLSVFARDRRATVAGIAAAMYERRRLVRENQEYQSSLERRLAEQANRTRPMFQNSLSALNAALEARDSYTRDHSFRITEIAVVLAAQLCPGDVNFQQKLRVAAMLHDIGKIGVPEAILRKPDKLTPEEYKNSRARNFAEVKIEAIFVFADSRDWASDQQIILDLLMSKGGYLGTRSETFEEGPPVFFSHNDVVWSASHDLTRIGMGALRVSLEAMFKAVTGKELKTTAFGKPQIGTFEFATRLLQQWRKDTHGIDSPPDTVYFVGDTPESDIRGTNEYDKHAENSWYSILVETGVFAKGTTPRFQPRATVDTVLDAVKHGMEREYRKSLRESMQQTPAIVG